MARDIAKWLDSVNLGQHVQAFIDNSIDVDLLKDLSEADLKELGLNIGDRRRLLRAVRNMKPAEATSGSTHDPDGSTATSRSSHPNADRRQVTILFADLVGSTALAEAADPEEYRELLGAYQSAAQDVIEACGGFIAKYMGDGLLVYFGYPSAHEDDAERAVRTGISLVEAVAKLDVAQSAELKVRVGIATGLVVAGDIVGKGSSQECTVLGEAPNLAARLQSIAEPGQVVVSESTRRLAGASFHYADLGTPELKGFSAPQQAWRVAGEVKAASRFKASRGGRLTPLVGRDEELELLSRRWSLAADGEGQVVLLSGEAGIGKSRLVETFLHSGSMETAKVLRYQCSPHHKNSALFPVIDQLKTAAGIEYQRSAKESLESVAQLLSPLSDGDSLTVALMARLLSIPIDSRYPALDYTSEQLKEKTLEALLAYLRSLCQRQPIVLFFEDLHWVDPTSLELLNLIVKEVRELRALAIATFRPEFSAPWVGEAHVSLVTFNRLNRTACTRIIAEVSGNKSLPTELVDQIIAKTDGVPLFVEELTQTVLRSDLVAEEEGSFKLAGNAISLSIPDTLQESLASRLDQLGDARIVAQTAAAIGQEFSRDILTAVLGFTERQATDALSRLIASGLVVPGAPRKLIFKHALIRDAAYESMLKSQRHELHGCIAETIESHFAELAATQPELLAHHYIEAQRIEPALDFLEKAGEMNLESCAYSEAVANLEQGLDLLEQLPAGPARARREVDMRILLGVPLMSKEGWASVKVEEHYRHTVALCEEFGISSQLFPALWGMWMNLLMRSKARMGCELADRLLTVGKRQNDDGLQLQAHHCQWTSRMTLGQLKETLEHTERGIELYSPEVHHALTYTYGGHDAGVCARQIGSLALWLAGYPDRAQKRLDEGVELANKLGHLNTRVEVLGVGMTLAAVQRDADLVTEWTERLISLTPAGEYETYERWADGVLGWAKYMRGQHEQGLRAMQSAVGAWLKDGVAWTAPMIALAAPIIAREVKPEAGLKLLDQALELVNRDETFWFESELNRVRGEVLERADTAHSDVAEASYKRALEIARGQNAKMLELRAATNLGRIWLNRGHTDEARELLTDTYSWFSEGFDKPDLKETQALLDQLS